MTELSLEMEYAKPELLRKVDLEKLENELTGKHVFTAGDLGSRSTVWGRALRQLEMLEVVEPYRKESSGPRRYYADIDEHRLERIMELLEMEKAGGEPRQRKEL